VELQTIVNGLLLGSNYALLAIGYALVFGVVRLLTLAHGQVFMISGLAAVVAIRTFGVPLAIGILIALVVGVAGGLTTDLLCFRPAGTGSEVAAAVATIGFAIALQNAAERARGGAEFLGLPQELETTDLHLGPVLVSSVQLLTFLLAAALMVGLTIFVRRTRWGAAMRAMGENPDALRLVGINPRTVGTITLAVSGVLAGAASILLALRLEGASPFSGLGVGLIGLAIISIAGLTSLTGAMVVGLGLGVVEAFASLYQLGGWRPAVPWILVIGVLLLRPRGLFVRTGR
jgi:branched-chain amino acid transport system permease protein